MNMTQLGLAACLALTAPIAMASAGRAETLILSANVPPTHWASTDGLEPYMACVTDSSGGEIDFNYFPTEQLATARESLSAVNDGLAQVSFLVPSVLTDRFPLNNIPMLPDMGDDVVSMTKAYREVLSDGGPLSVEFEKNGVKPLLLNLYPPYQVMSVGDPIRTPADFEGKKISVFGGAQSFTVRALGAVPVELGGPDIYMALQQGTVDGNIYALPSADSWKLNEVTKSISTNANFGGAAGVLAIDTAVWDRLSPSSQAALVDCGLKVEASLAERADALAEELARKFAEEGMEVYEFTDEAKSALAERLKGAATEFISRLTDRGLPGQEVYDQYREALGKS